jgi:hypothetical protein
LKYLLTIALLVPVLVYAQSGGSSGFQALRLMTNARTAALGGENVSTTGGDLSVFQQNPALLDSVNTSDAVFMYNPFFADIQAITFQYQAEFNKMGALAFGINYINYGEFQQTDDTGAASGTFHARDYVITVGKSHRLGPFVMGANLKFVHSGIAGYTANAMALDLGGVFQVSKNFSTGMVIANLGGVLSDYSDGNNSLPLTVKAGFTFKPEHMPIRFTLTGHNFTDGEREFYLQKEKPNFADHLFTRVTIGGEILFSKNINFLLGYDHNRKQELRLEESSGGAGFSYGVMVGVKDFRFRFSRATYHAAGGTSYISVQRNLKTFKKLF